MNTDIAITTTCVACGSALAGMDGSPPWSACSSCGQRYPVIGGRIPILMADPVTYLARLYVQHKHYLRRLGERVEGLRSAARAQPQRRKQLERLAGAYEHNGRLFETFCGEIDPFVSPADIVKAINAPEFVGYATSFEYLERDWCFLADGERELVALRRAVEDAIAAHAPDRRAVLVVGAGTGRLAWDLLGQFEEVYALDMSLVMAQQFHGAMDDGLTFQSVHTRSVSRDQDMVIERVARIPPAGRDASRRFRYIVGDATKLPFADGSVAAVVSVYFTDVLPLAGVLGEIARVLKPGGLFLHAGPLEYHFDEPAMHLSAESVKAALAEQGFTIAEERHVRTEHLGREGIWAHRIFDNWVVSAVRPGVAGSDPANEMLAGEAVLEPGATCSSVPRRDGRQGERTTNVEIRLPSGALLHRRHLGAQHPAAR